MHSTRNHSPSTNTTVVKNTGGYPTELRLTFGFIALLAFLANGILCVMFVKRRTMLRKSHNTLVFALAITDTLTGIFIGVSPLYVLGQGTLSVPQGIAGEMFCRLIDNSFFVWAFVKFSVALVTCMALERWYAIARPLQHILYFTRNRTVLYIGVAFFLVCISSSLLVFEKKLVVNNMSLPTCVWAPFLTSLIANQVFTVLYCTVTVFIPLFITMATFGRIYFVLQRSVPQIQNLNAQTNRKRAEVRLCLMSALVALCLTVCFAPNQLSYIFSKFGLTQLGSPGHHLTVVLSLFNSCINPLVYCLSNKFYRRELLLLFCRKKISVNPITSDNSKSDVDGVKTLRCTNNVLLGDQAITTQV